MLCLPINIRTWVETHLDKLKPPVNNYCLWNEGFIVMIISGPNSRTDYHINETPEFFYQYKGPMILKVIDNCEFKEIVIEENDVFFLPENIPHCPVRYSNTIGIVVEQKRPENSLDRLRWYCEDCKSIVYEDVFNCTNLGTQIKEVIEKYTNNVELRTCKVCGKINSTTQ